MVITSTVGSGVCLVMLDFDKEIGEKLLISLGMSQSDQLPDALDMALTVADRCMSLRVNSTASMNLMDIIELPARNPSYPGEKRTPRQDVIDLVIVPIEEGFAQLESALNTQPPTLHDHPMVTQVRDIISDINMKSLYWSDVVDIERHPTYRFMDRTNYLVSLNCDDVQLGDKLPPPLNDIYVPGLRSMAVDGYVVWDQGVEVRTRAIAADMNSATFNCPVELIGTCGTASGSNAATRAVCEAGKAFLEETKLPLARDPVFVCRYFQQPGAPWGTKCDMRNMYKDANEASMRWIT